MPSVKVAVVGGGIIGAAVARQVTRSVERSTVTLFEKEQSLAAHQTGHNSGVVHAGLYYTPGSLKARLCRRGGDLLRDFAQERGLPYEECGKVVVARDESELGRMRDIYSRALANGVPGIREIDSAELRDLEPHARGIAALHSPRTAIVDYVAATNALADDVRAAGGSILHGHAVSAIRQRGSEVLLTAGEITEHFDLVITCAGLQSDRVARLAGDRVTSRIVPFFGDYLLLRPNRRVLVNGLIYPVPDPRYPFLGVHLTKRVDGEVMVGPNAFLSMGREAYRRRRASFRDMASVLSFVGFWRFAVRNVPAALREARGVACTRAFVKEARKYVPELQVGDVVEGSRGVRAQTMLVNGALADDFLISGTGRIVNVRNAPSPGATASMAIAEYVVEAALSRIG